MFIKFGQTVVYGIALVNDVAKKSTKEYKEKEAKRRSEMSAYDRHNEDMRKFYRSMS